MSYPPSLLPTRMAELEEKKDGEWLRNPATTAHYLSRGKWRHAVHLDYIAELLTEMEFHPIFLIITVPPRHGKSELISHWTPVWFLKKWPHKRIILASYQAGFASDWGGNVKNTIIENEGELGLQLAMDTKAKAQWKIAGYGGGMLSTGIGGAITGRGGDLLIIDDPIKSYKEALSETYRNAIKQWYRSTLRTRAQPGASIIILMTRWHEDDLAGWLLEESKNTDSDIPQDPWQSINLPAIAEGDDPLGRNEGEALWPEMYDLNSLLNMRDSSTGIGSYWFSAEYQGSPRPEGGSILKEAWFNYFSEAEDPLLNEKAPVQRCLQAWDTAFEKGEENSRTACVTWIETKLGYFVMDVWADRVEFPELVDIVKAKYKQWIPERIFIEHKASGHSLVQQLRRDTKLPIVPVKAVTDKAVRVHSISGIVEAGKVFLPARAPWLSEFLHEVCSFPSARLNDITDAFAHGLMQMRPSLARTGRREVRRGYRRAPYRRD